MVPTNTTQEIDSALDKLFLIRDTLNDIIIALREKREDLVSQEIDAAIDPEKLTAEGFMAFNRWGEINQGAYGKLRGWFESHYMEKGLMFGGSGGSHKQAILEVKMDQNKPFEEQLGLLDFWPYLKPLPMDRGSSEEMIYCKIFEHTLSQHYSFSLRATPDRQTIIVQTHIGDERFKTMDGDIKKALEFIYKKHPYIRFGRK